VRFEAWQAYNNNWMTDRRARLWQRLASRPSDMSMPLFALWSRRQRLRLRPRRLFFLSLEAYRAVRRPDGWWDPYLDDVGAQPALAGQVTRCEQRRFFWPLRPVTARRHLFTDELMWRHLRGERRRPDSGAVRAADEVIGMLREAMAARGVALPEESFGRLRRSAERMLGFFIRERAWFAEVFERAKPRVLAVLSAYTRPGAVAAARERGAAVVEFQHGAIHPDHPGYIWPEAARGQRDRLPLPNHIATYGDFWREILLAGGYWRPEQVHGVGSVRVDAVRAATPPGRRGGDFSIVFTTQYAAREETLPALSEFVRIAEAAGFPFKLIVKVHRQELHLQADYERLGQSSARVQVLSPYAGDTLTLIARADVHVSAWSTCHYEAIGLGTPTIVLESAGADRMAGLEDFVGVHRVSSAAEWLAVLQRLAAEEGAGAGVPTDETEALFCRGAVSRAVDLLSAQAGLA
jgi:hypothetical protein